MSNTLFAVNKTLIECSPPQEMICEVKCYIKVAEGSNNYIRMGEGKSWRVIQE